MPWPPNIARASTGPKARIISVTWSANSLLFAINIPLPAGFQCPKTASRHRHPEA
jgi:hypothetical protein